MASKWGSFLSSVESRLDNILLDDEAKTQQQKQAASKVNEQPGKKDGMAVPSARGSSPARATSTNRAQDRLNERLARAMANKNLGRKGDGSPASSAVPSRTNTPANAADSPRSSIDVQAPHDTRTLAAATQDVDQVEEPRNMPTGLPEANTIIPSVSLDGPTEAEPIERTSTESDRSRSLRPSFEVSRTTTPNITDTPQLNGDHILQPKAAQEYDETIAQLRQDNETAELKRQEEIRDYMERIDALQAKLQYLTREAAEAAKRTASEASSGSVEQKLASKDEKIALLIEEGQKLSQTELKHMTAIKKLRSKAAEDEKAATDLKRTAERHERAAKDAQDQAKRAAAAEKRALDQVKSYSKLERDLESARSELASKDTFIQDLQVQLSEVTSATKIAEEQAQAAALEAERRRAADLSEELTNVRAEKDLAEKNHKTVLRELHEKAEREKERARVAEIERQAELNIIESKLEAYRARAEEASAGQGGDVQAKLLRQIETLQNQYAVASENWQGIEGSLLSRVAALEKERDETSKKEGDVRRKAREANSKVKRLEEDVEQLQSKSEDLASERSSAVAQIATLQERLSRAEADASAARNDLKTEKEAWEARQAQKLEEERCRIKDELLRSPPSASDALYHHAFRSDSPSLHHSRTRKSSNAAGDPNTYNNNTNSPQTRRLPSLHGLAITTSGHSSGERPSSRRSSNQPLYTADVATPIAAPPGSRALERQDSMSTVPTLSLNNGIPETPSINFDGATAEDDFFSGVHTPATPPERASALNDVISASTAAAGPSVQLVERMSAAVRRLESEKASHKEDLARLSQQRDEAREQVVELMRDNEGKKAVDEKVQGLEGEMEKLQRRYETTLEMLGEKSERVEELQADVADLKSMMREMVEESVQKGR